MKGNWMISYLDAELFRIESVPDYLEEIVRLLTTGHFLEGYTPM